MHPNTHSQKEATQRRGPRLSSLTPERKTWIQEANHDWFLKAVSNSSRGSSMGANRSPSQQGGFPARVAINGGFFDWEFGTYPQERLRSQMVASLSGILWSGLWGGQPAEDFWLGCGSRGAGCASPRLLGVDLHTMLKGPRLTGNTLNGTAWLQLVCSHQVYCADGFFFYYLNDQIKRYGQCINGAYFSRH